MRQPRLLSSDEVPSGYLDEIDQVLVRELMADARKPYSRLAEAVGLTSEGTRQRVQRLLRSGTVSIEVVIDPQAIWPSGLAAGFVVAVNADASEVADDIAKMPNVTFLSIVGAKEPIQGELRCRDERDLITVLDRIREHPGVRGVDAMRYLFVAKESFARSHRSSDRERYEIDELDRHIIVALQRDGRASYSSIARTLGSSVGTVRTRIQQMLETGVFVVGAVTTTGAHGLNGGLCFVRVNKPARQVAEAAAQFPEVNFVAATTGSADVIVTVLASDESAFLDVVDRLRVLEGVSSVESHTHLRIVKEDYSLVEDVNNVDIA
jgi:DNA-binding Lrp family transcriptional regulator